MTIFTRAFVFAVCSALFLVPPAALLAQPSVECGETVEGVIAAPGEKDTFQFSAAPGDAIEVLGEGIDRTLQLHIRVLDPQGLEVGEKNIASTRSGPIPLTKGGTYRLVLSDYLNEKTGRYAFTLQFLSGQCAQQISCGETIEGKVEQRGLLKAMTFQGTQGEAVRAAASVAGNLLHQPTLRIYGPHGEPLNDLAAGSTPSVVLPEDGQYTLAVGNFFSFFENPRADQYGISLDFTTGRCATDAKGGQTLESRVDHLLEQDSFSFSGATGSWVNVASEALDYSTWKPSVTIFDSAGRQVGAAPGSSLDFYLPAAGTYNASLLIKGARARRYRINIHVPGLRQQTISQAIIQNPLKGTAVAFNSNRSEFLVAYSVDLPGSGLYEIFTQRLKAGDNSLIGDETRISDMGPETNSAYEAREPSVAYNSTDDEYLVVWAGDDTRDEDFEIFGQRINAQTGQPTGTNDFKISTTGPDGESGYGAFHPKVVYNPSSHEYLVVWHGGRTSTKAFEVFGQRISASGTLAGGQQRLNTSAIASQAGYPDVIHNADRNEYFVAWQTLGASPSRVVGRRFGATLAGSLQPAEFVISQRPGSSQPTVDRPGPAAVLNRSTAEYLVVWTGADGDVHGQRVPATNDRLTGPSSFRISLTGSARHPRAAINPVAGEFLVVWQRDLAEDEHEIWGQRLNGVSGKKIGAVGETVSFMGPREMTGFSALQPNLVVNPVDSQFFVTWHGNALPTLGYRAVGATLPGAAGNGPGTIEWMAASDDLLSSPSSTPLHGAVAVDEEGSLFANGGPGGLVKVSSDGAVAWSLPAGTIDSTGQSTPMLRPDGSVLTTGIPGSTASSVLAAFNPTGTEAWTTGTGAAGWFPLAGDLENNVFAAAAQDRLYKYSPSGAEQWNAIPPGYTPAGAPVVTREGRVYLALQDLLDANVGALWAIDHSANTLWLTPLGWDPRSPFSLAVGNDGTIYVGGTRLGAVSPEGTVKWTARVDSNNGANPCSPSIDANSRILCTSSNRILGFNRSGETIFTLFTDSPEERFHGVPTIGPDGAVYAVSTLPGESTPTGLSSGAIYALDVDGRAAWRREIEGEDFTGSNLTAVAERLYVISAEGNLYSIRSAGGEKKSIAWASAGAGPQHKNLAGELEDFRLFFAQFADGADALFSQLLLLNPDPNSARDARISLTDNSGDPLTVDLNSETVTGQKTITIPPSGMRLLTTDGKGSLVVGAARVEADGRLGGVILFGGSVGLAGVGSSIELHDAFLAPMERDTKKAVNTGIALMNLENGPVTVKLELFDPEGTLLAEAALAGPKALPPGGHVAQFVDSFAWNEPIDFSSFSGLLRVSATGTVSATVIQTRPKMFATMPVSPRVNRQWGKLLNDERPTPLGAAVPYPHQLNFAQFADGQGLLFSQIILFNLDDTEKAAARVSLRNDQGEPLSVDLNGVQVSGMLQLEVPPSGMRVLKTDGLGDVVAGSAFVESDRPLGGVILFGGVVGLAGVGNSQELTSGFLAPMQTNLQGKVNTGIALMNLEETEQELTLELCDADGVVLAKAVLAGAKALAAHGHLARYVDEFEWDVSPDFRAFDGVLRVRGTGRLAATVIQTRPGQFATMPVVPFRTPD